MAKVKKVNIGVTYFEQVGHFWAKQSSTKGAMLGLQVRHSWLIMPRLKVRVRPGANVTKHFLSVIYEFS